MGQLLFAMLWHIAGSEIVKNCHRFWAVLSITLRKRSTHRLLAASETGDRPDAGLPVRATLVR